MAGRSVKVEPGGVRGGGATAGAGSTPADIPGVPPWANDEPSVGAAGRLSSKIAHLNQAVLAANHFATTVAARLHASATAYEQQEWFSAAELGSGGGFPAGPELAVPELVPLAVPQPLPVPAGGGVRPANGRQASEVLHAGPGTAGLQASEAACDELAQRLHQSAATLRAARRQVEASWESEAAHKALHQLDELISTYTGLAGNATGLAREARMQAENYSRTVAQMPHPQKFALLAAKYQQAAAGASLPGPVGIQNAQAAKQLAQEYAVVEHHATTTYTPYSAGTTSVAELGPPGNTGDAHAGISGPGGAGQLQSGAGPGTDPQAQQEANPFTHPMVKGAASGMGQILDTVLPAIVSAVSGASTGAISAVTGAAGSLVGIGGQLASGAASVAKSTMSSPPGGTSSGGSPQQPNPTGAGGGPADGGHGAGGAKPGDTEPSSTPSGPLVTPAGSGVGASLAAAPVTETAAALTTNTAATPGGAPVAGGMMGPMGTPMGGSGGGETDRRLYAERRLHIETPPNAEPVKGRREPRQVRDDATRT